MLVFAVFAKNYQCNLNMPTKCFSACLLIKYQ
jgi:hypothetical protein